MKNTLSYIYFILLVALLSCQIFGQYYVKPTASGSGDGSNWANAADWDNDFSAYVSAGDTIYMDGGTVSQTYNGKSMFKSGSAGNYIYFVAGKYSPDPVNHSGEVIITNSGGSGLSSNGYSYLYFKGLKLYNSSQHGTYFYAGSNHIVFDSLSVIENNGVGFWSEESNYHEIKNCVVISEANSGAQDNDNILYQKNAHHIFIHHNYLYQRNQQNSGLHIDNIQFSNYAHSVFIYNNICIVDSGVQGHNFILGCTSDNYQYEDTVLIFNNYLYNGGYGSNTGYTFYSDNIYNREAEGRHPYNPFAITINNTLVSANCGIFTTRDNGRTAFASNNIMLKLGQNGGAPPVNPQSHMALGGEPVDSFHTNLYYQSWNGAMTYSGGVWSNWLSAGGDGVNANPNMKNNLTYYNAITNPNPFEINPSSPAIDAGTDMTYMLKAFTYLPGFDYTTDILGNPRDANWDIGAFEYQQGIADTIPSFSFTQITNANLNTEYIGSAVFTGADSTFHVWTTTGARFNINSSSGLNSTMKTAVNGDVVYVETVTGASYSAGYTETIVAGGVSRDFTVTTKAYPPSGSRKILKGKTGKISFDKDGKVIYTQ